MPRQIGWKPRLIHPSSATSGSLSNLSVLAELLFWRIISQADDQGRLTGNPRYLKAITCPLRDEITTATIPTLLNELKPLLICYQSSNSGEELIQIRNWWTYQSMQWAYPSSYPPPEGWVDHLRYKHGGKVVTENWPPTGQALPKPTPEAPTQEPIPAVKQPSFPSGYEEGLFTILERLPTFPSNRNTAKLRELLADYPDLNYQLEFKKFVEWWSKRKIKVPWLALRNWLEKAQKGETYEKEGTATKSKRRSRALPENKYQSEYQRQKPYREEKKHRLPKIKFVPGPEHLVKREEQE